MVLVVISEWSSRTLAIADATRSILVCIAQRQVVTHYVLNLTSLLLIRLGWIAAKDLFGLPRNRVVRLVFSAGIVFSLTTIQPEQCFQPVSAKFQQAERGPRLD